MRETIFTPAAAAPIGPYSQAVKTNGPFIYTSGQIPADASGAIVGADIASQTEQAILNVKNILEHGHSSLAHVVKTTVFLKDIGDFASMNAVYERYFHGSKPARSTVQVARLPKDALVEIEAIATLAE